MFRGYVYPSSPNGRAGYISGVDFGCFSISYRDCEALEEREEQVDFTLFVSYTKFIKQSKYSTKMKKLTIILCALVIALGTNALPVNRKAVSVEPVKKAVQSDYQFTSPVYFVALNYEGEEGEYAIFFYDSNYHFIIQANINTGDNNTIAGTYTVGTEGGQKQSSYFYLSNQQHPVNNGILTIVPLGTSYNTGEDIYYVEGSDWEVKDGKNTVTYGFTGFVTGLAAWKSYYTQCNQQGLNCDQARITLTETVPSTVVDIVCNSNNVETDETSFLSKGYWSISGTGYEAGKNKVYSLSVNLKGDQVLGLYNNDDICTIEDENKEVNRLIIFSVSEDDGANYTDLSVTEFYGNVTHQVSPDVLQCYFLVKAGDKLYRVILNTDYECYILKNGTCGAKGDNLTWNYNDCEVLTVNGIGAMADYGKTNAPWYNQREDIHSVVTEDGVASIGNNAFYDYKNLTSVTLGSGVINIGASAFEGCLGLTSVIIPSSIKSIGSSAFAHCYNLKIVTFESSVPPTVSYDAFLYCTCDFIVPCGSKEAYISALGVSEDRVTEDCGIETGDAAIEKEPLHTPQDAHKNMDNGILYIYRNGIRYTAQGQRLD